MSIESVPTAVVGGSWVAFWIQLPALALAVAVTIVAVTALRRARPEDVPRVFAAFAAVFARRPREQSFRSRRTGRRTPVTEEIAK